MFTPDKIEQGQLPSGIRYALAHVPKAGELKGQLIVNAGAADETPSQSGAAHFVEHILGMLPATYSDPVQGCPETYLEYTNHDFQSSPKDAQRYLKAFGEGLTCDAFDRKIVESERKVIIREIAQSKYRYDLQAREHHYGTVYAGQPFAKIIKGTQQDVRQLTSEELHHFFRTHYTADNLVLSMVGKINDRVLHQMEEVGQVLSKEKPPERIKSTPVVGSYGLKQRSGYGDVVTTISFQEEDYSPDKYDALFQTAKDKMRSVNGLYTTELRQVRHDNHAVHMYQFMSSPGAAKRVVTDFLGYCREFSSKDANRFVKSESKMRLRETAICKEQYLWRATAMNYQMRRNGQIYVPVAGMVPSAERISTKQLVADCREAMQQLPSVTFYGNVKAARLPDHSQWVAEVMRL